MSAEQVEIVADRGGRLGQEAARLAEGERQEVQLLRERFRLPAAEVRAVGPEQGHGLQRGHDLYVRGRGDAFPATHPRGDQYVAWTTRQPLGHRGALLGVVENDQPSVASAQVRLGHGRRRSRVGTPLDKCQLHGERGNLITDQRRVVRGDPPHQVVGGGSLVRVLDRDLGFPDSPTSAQRLNDRRAAGIEALAQSAQGTFPADELGISRLHVPYRRERPGHLARRRVRCTVLGRRLREDHSEGAVGLTCPRTYADTAGGP